MQVLLSRKLLRYSGQCRLLWEATEKRRRQTGTSNAMATMIKLMLSPRSKKLVHLAVFFHQQ